MICVSRVAGMPLLETARATQSLKQKPAAANDKAFTADFAHQETIDFEGL